MHALSGFLRAHRGRRELFLDREQAEAFIAEVEQDEPETAALLSVVAVELEQAPN
jgi:hypothetical protein